jgi:hypothetical protein
MAVVDDHRIARFRMLVEPFGHKDMGEVHRLPELLRRSLWILICLMYFVSGGSGMAGSPGETIG